MLAPGLLWRGIIEDLFEEVMLFFYPAKVGSFDLSATKFLDEEHKAIFLDAEDNLNFAEKLIQLHSKNGEKQLLLVHLAIQIEGNYSVDEHIFRRYCRLFDKYGLNIEALVICIDGKANNIPAYFHSRAIDSQLAFKYKFFRLIDQDLEALERAQNPFAAVLLSSLEYLYTKRSKETDQLELKLAFFKNAFSHGFSPKQLNELAAFIKYYHPFVEDEMNKKFDQAIFTITNNEDIMGITDTILEAARQRGIEEGKNIMLAENTQQSASAKEEVGESTQEMLHKAKEEGIAIGMEQGKIEGIEIGRAEMKKELQAELEKSGNIDSETQLEIEKARQMGLKEGLQKGREEGINQGRKEGFEQGIEEGIIKGRQELEEKLAKLQSEEVPKQEQQLKENLEKGIKQGRRDKAISTIQNLLKSDLYQQGLINYKDISQALRVKMEDVKKIHKKLLD